MNYPKPYQGFYNLTNKLLNFHIMLHKYVDCHIYENLKIYSFLLFGNSIQCQFFIWLINYVNG